MPIEGEIKQGRELGFIGQKASRKFIWRICMRCQKAGWIRVDNFRNICKRCSASQNISAFCSHQRGKTNPGWKGGRRYCKGGYIEILLQPTDPFFPMAKKSTHYVLEHRLIMAKRLGRLLKPSEHVHHFDGKRDHNVETNLEITTKNQHKKSYFDGYRQGFKEGEKSKVESLYREIRLLRLEVRALRAAIQPGLLEEVINADR